MDAIWEFVADFLRLIDVNLIMQGFWLKKAREFYTQTFGNFLFSTLPGALVCNAFMLPFFLLAEDFWSCPPAKNYRFRAFGPK